MSSILNYFLGGKKDRSASLPRAPADGEVPASRRDASVPPTPKTAKSVTIEYPATVTTKTGTEVPIKEPKRSIFDSRTYLRQDSTSQPAPSPLLSLPIYKETKQPQMSDPELVIERKADIPSAITGLPTGPGKKPLDYRLDTPLDDIRLKLAEAGSRYYPSPYPQRMEEFEFFPKDLTSRPITQDELRKALDLSRDNNDADGRNMRRFVELRKEIEFCKKYLQINDVKRVRLQQEIEQMRGTPDTSMISGDLGGEALEVRIAKERIELERLKNQMTQIGWVDPGRVSYMDRTPKKDAGEIEVSQVLGTPVRLPSIFPDTQGIATSVELTSLSRNTSAFPPAEPSPTIQKPKVVNPLAARIK